MINDFMKCSLSFTSSDAVVLEFFKWFVWWL